MSRSLASGAALVSMLLASSCTTMVPQHETVLDGYQPEEFSMVAGETAHQTEWWKGFESKQLNGLVDEAFSSSLTLEQAAARLEQAEAIARKSGASGRPQLDAKGDYSSRHTSDDMGDKTDESYSAGLYASYEVDLWGRIRFTKKASIADWKASEFDLQTAAMTLSSELAQTYFRWLAANETLAIYQSQLEASSNKLESIELRYRTGQSTSLAVLQQRQQLAAAEAKLPPVRAQIESYETSIALLAGKIPGTDLGLTVEPLPELPPQPSAGLPAQLLEQRPDIQSARLALESADWSVDASQAARLPTISLTGSLTTGGDAVDRLFDDWASNLAAGLLGPLLDGGSLRDEVARTTAVAREQVGAYRQAVLEAMKETEDALSNEHHQTDYVEALGKQYDAALRSEEESIRRYQRGVLKYTDTLDAAVARESLEITCSQARTDLLVYRIQLYRALGGDWTFILEEER